MIKVTLPDGSFKEFDGQVSALQVAEAIGPGLAKAALAARINGTLSDITTLISTDCNLEFVTVKSDPKLALEMIRHSCAHVMAEAICQIYPEAKLVYGPAVENGFYYDVDLDTQITPDDFARIENEMKNIIAQDRPFVRYEMAFNDAMSYLEKEGNRYKIENAKAANSDIISFYVTGSREAGNFEDLCRGPHIARTGQIGGYKVMSIAGAYFRGDASEKMLQRIYGTAFADKKELKQYLFQLEEAKKRDHRVIGKQLDLFSFQDEGPGFAFYHPKGMIIWNEMLKYWRYEHDKDNYCEISTPIMLNEKLWHQSGHWDNYKQNMYFVDIDEERFAVKPMNCPGGCLVYKSRNHSYRELPIRMAELGLVHRHEASGVLHGLFRVRRFTQDDAHIFCSPDQIADEVIGVIELVFRIYGTFGLKDVHLELSTRPAKSIGSDEMWDVATESLKQALERKKIDYKLNPGDGAFYGPKIDFHVRDCLGRSWQLGTIQCDFALPERFDLTYVSNSNTNLRPVMLHRAILGSLDRFFGIIIEHFAGSFPTWLSPEQVRVMPISEKTNDYASKVYSMLREAGIRATLDLADDKINAKIKKGYEQKLPYMLILGPNEAENNSVTVRVRGCENQQTFKLQDFIEKITCEINSRSLESTMS